MVIDIHVRISGHGDLGRTSKLSVMMYLQGFEIHLPLEEDEQVSMAPL